MKLNGNYVREFENPVYVASSAACVGKKESEGPLKDIMDVCFSDDGIGCSSWEDAEAKLIKTAVDLCLNKAEMNNKDIGAVFSGDLLNQCTASTYGLRESDIPFLGLFGACSTMALSLSLASVFVDSGYTENTLCVTSSHFCSAEKQFRYPLEYGAQRSPASQRTVTGSGAFILSSAQKSPVVISRILFGKIVDLGISDTSNMGAAMAPVDVKIEP